MKATNKSAAMSRAEQDEWLHTVYAAATPTQRTILREIVEQVVSGKRIDELSGARFRARFGKPSPQLLSALDALEYRRAIERQRAGR